MIVHIRENYLFWLRKQIPIFQFGDLLPSSYSKPYWLKAVYSFFVATSMGQELSGPSVFTASNKFWYKEESVTCTQ